MSHDMTVLQIILSTISTGTGPNEIGSVPAIFSPYFIYTVCLAKKIMKAYTVKPVSSSHSKRRAKIGFQYRLMQVKSIAILSTFVKLPFSI